MKKLDLRIVKTKNNLYNALLELMKEKSFEEIKVSDICSKALINRSTFYSHYEDKYELLEDLIKDLKESLSNDLKKNTTISNTKEYYLEMIKLFLNNIEEKRNSYLAIAINNRNSILTDILYDVINKDIIEHLHKNYTNEKEVPLSIVANFYLGAVISIGLSWIQNINKYTKEEMLNYLNILIPDDK